MIYRFLKLVVRVSLQVFYKNIVFSGSQKLVNHGPLIVVGNHPNTFMDPLIIASRLKQEVGFLGNASIFVHPMVNAIFNYFNVIPVYRQKDVAPGIKPDNDQTFRDSYTFLEQKKTLMIFPEGNSYHALKLRKIKTGVSRISLGVESKNDFNLGLKILPVGLYYSNPTRFRSKIYINVGDTISVNDFEETYKKDDIAGVQALTTAIRNALDKLTISTVDEEQEALFVQIKRIYKKRLLKNFKQSDSREEEFIITREIAGAIQYFKVTFPEKYAFLKAKIDRCSLLLDQLKAKSSDTIMIQNKARKMLLVFTGVIYSIVGLPWYLFGLIQNYLPYIAPYLVARRLTKEPEYYAPIMMTLGILAFPAYYFLSGFLFERFVSQEAWWTLIYVAFLPLSGYYALHYRQFIAAGISFIKLNSIFNSQSALAKELSKLKKIIFEELDIARLIYLKR